MRRSKSYYLIVGAIIIAMIVFTIIPSVWAARIIAVGLFIWLVSNASQRENYSEQQLNDFISLLELIVLIFIIHIAVSHGGVVLGGVD